MDELRDAGKGDELVECEGVHFEILLEVGGEVEGVIVAVRFG